MNNMKSLKIITILVLAFGLIQACKALKDGKTSDNSFDTQLMVFQDGSEISVSKPFESIEIERNGFSLRFFNNKYDSKNKKFHSAQIAAFTDKSEFDKIKSGMMIRDLLCFKPGSGMAPDRSGRYESLIFDNRGHHYATYENSKSKRLNLLEESNGLLRLEFEINSLYYNSKEVAMAETELQAFYLAFLIDKNLNGTIDSGELHMLTIKME